jgi:hypothetical protein
VHLQEGTGDRDTVRPVTIGLRRQCQQLLASRGRADSGQAHRTADLIFACRLSKQGAHIGRSRAGGQPPD